MPAKFSKSASRRGTGSKSVEFSIDSLSDMAGKLSYEETLSSCCEALYTYSDVLRCSVSSYGRHFTSAAAKELDPGA